MVPQNRHAQVTRLPCGKLVLVRHRDVEQRGQRVETCGLQALLPPAGALAGPDDLVALFVLHSYFPVILKI